MAHLELEPLRHMGLLADRPRGLPSAGARMAARSASADRIGDLSVEVRPLAACAAIVSQWRRLAERAIEPNIFFEPDFLLSAVRHLPEAQDHLAILVWLPAGRGAQRLVGFWPFREARRPRLMPLHAGLRSRFAASGAPLLDRSLPVETASALVQAALRHGDREVGLAFPQLPLDGAAARSLRAACLLAGLSAAELDPHLRACVWGEAGPAEAGRVAREARRGLRQLSAHGDVSLVSATDPPAVREATELFLALEASGWKALRGTALLSNPRDAAFFRSMSRALSRSGGIEVHLLQAGARVAAAGVVLRSGEQAWYVKTSHDESLASAGPGAILSRQIGVAFGCRPNITLLDSCAIPGHAMIERIWPGRLRIGDLFIGEAPSLGRVVARETLRRRLRAAVKAAWYRLRGRAL